MNKNNIDKIATNSSMISVAAKNIIPHEEYARFGGILATADYMLPSGAILTEQSMAVSLLMHPIMVIRAKSSKERYFCLGGIRSLLMAQSIVDLEKELLVRIVDRPNSEDIKLLVNADVMVFPLLYSLRSIATIGRIHQEMNIGEIEALFQDGMDKKAIFAQRVNYALNTIFSNSKNKSADKNIKEA